MRLIFTAAVVLALVAPPAGAGIHRHWWSNDGKHAFRNDNCSRHVGIAGAYRSCGPESKASQNGGAACPKCAIPAKWTKREFMLGAAALDNDVDRPGHDQRDFLRWLWRGRKNACPSYVLRVHKWDYNGLRFWHFHFVDGRTGETHPGLGPDCQPSARMQIASWFASLAYAL